VCDTLVIVDVLSFLDRCRRGCSRGATVVPFPYFDARAEEFARQQAAELAVPRARMSAAQPYSLSPPSLSSIPRGTRLVLPSPNGSTLTVAASGVHGAVITGCLRNADAVGAAVGARGGTVGVIAAGERWRDGSLRPAMEDLIGAGAIIAQISGRSWSPEAAVAVAAFEHVRGELRRHLSQA
jgi:2-phosphosulfolactate phosphatase